MDWENMMAVRFCCTMISNLLLAMVLLQAMVICSLEGNIRLTTSALQFELSKSDPAFELQSRVYFGDVYYDVALWTDSSSVKLSDFNNSYCVGRVVYSKPIQFLSQISKTAFSFSTYFTFQIKTAAAYDRSGDGMAFFIAPRKDLPEGVADGGGLGVFDDSSTDASRHILAVEFDTFQNGGLFDNSASHIALDINGIISSLVHDTSDSSNELYLYKNSTLHTWIQYDATSKRMDLWASTQPRKPSSPVLFYPCDLSTLFQNEMYVGLSAADGAYNQSVTIMSWNFTIDEETLSPAPSPSPAFDKRRPISLLVITLPVALGVVLAIVMAIVVYKVRRKSLVLVQGKRSMKAAALANISTAKRFSYRELSRATKEFSEEQRVGEGGFSVVYRGVLADGSVVAVKKLKKEGRVIRMEEEFTAELEVLSRIRHRNLIELEGWCYHKGDAMLVYKFMTRGSLDRYIFRDCNSEIQMRSSFGGVKRHEILIRVAAALEYLHEGLEQRVLHRDVKAANVMLTDDWEVKLGDFGLSRLIKQDNRSTTVTCTAAGTPGYMAPEVVYTGRVSHKADVYGFGALVLEVACGRRVRDEKMTEEGLQLMDWVWRLYESNRLLEALDPLLQMEIRLEPSGQAAEKWRCVLHVGLLCCWAHPETRPSMTVAYHALRDTVVLSLPPTWPSYGPTPIMNINMEAGWNASTVTVSTLSPTSSGVRRWRRATSSVPNPSLNASSVVSIISAR